MDINQLRRNCFLFIVENLPAVNKDDLSALPVDLILEIIQHPTAEMYYDDYEESEKQLFDLIWNRIKDDFEEAKMNSHSKSPEGHPPSYNCCKVSVLPTERIWTHPRSERSHYRGRKGSRGL